MRERTELHYVCMDISFSVSMCVCQVSQVILKCKLVSSRVKLELSRLLQFVTQENSQQFFLH